MIVLGIDAARSAFSAAAVRDGECLAAETAPSKSALEHGLAAIERVVRRSGEPQRLGVGIGPGSFTGVRIAISYAKSLALAWGVPLCGIDTFDALECGAEGEPGPVLAVVQGRKGVLSVRYRSATARWRGSGYTIDVLNEFEARGFAREPLRVTGDAQDVLAGLAERGWQVNPVEPLFSPPAVAVALLAAERSTPASAHEVRADYGELPPAKIPRL